MTVRLVNIHRLAARELRDAAQRYGLVSPATEQCFRAAVSQALTRIANAAEQCPPYGRLYRWVKPGRFPYIVYFRIVSDAEATVYAAGHERRRPGYWLRRVGRP